MYRPTVRYHDNFKKYVDDLFLATHLDRNQILRAALFTAAYSPEFLKIIDVNKRRDVPLPSPKWQLNQSEFYLEQNRVVKQPVTKGLGMKIDLR